jgi:hypothetical protein
VTAAYDALLASATPDFVVLAEVQPMEPLAGWTAAGGGLTNTYYCSFLSQIATTVVAGGLYRRLDSVRQNATALTLRASAALVDANLGSYFLDTATNRLYVSTNSGASPDTVALLGAWFTLFFSSTSVALSGQPLYAPMIAAALPTLTDELGDILLDATRTASGELGLHNTDGVFDRLSKQYVWRNKTVTFKLGGGALAYSDFTTIETLRINAITVDDERCVLQLEDLGTILNQTLPLRTWGDGTVTSSIPVTSPAAGINGLAQPIVFGYVENCPLAYGGLTATGKDAWYAFDANISGYGSCQYVSVGAVNRSTREGFTLQNAVHYTTSGAVVTIIDPTYGYADYDIIANLQQLGTLASPTFGTMALAILRICGESDTNIDLTAFAAADVAAPEFLSMYVGTPIAAVDLMRSLERSIAPYGGQVYRGSDGRWTCRVLTADLPTSVVELTDADFVTWEPQADLRATLNEVRVRYAYKPLVDEWLEVSSSDDTVFYGAETSDAHRVDTWLGSPSGASALAGHLRFLAGVPRMVIQAEQRGLSMIASRAGDLVSVTRTRAPVARTGAYETQLLRIAKIEKALGAEVPTVTVWLDDLGGQADRIARYTDSTPIAWSTATNVQKARYGFYADANGYIDATDPLTHNAKVYS